MRIKSNGVCETWRSGPGILQVLKNGACCRCPVYHFGLGRCDVMARAWTLESRELRGQRLFDYQIAVRPSAS